jgi:hypothetical protein
MKQNINKYAGIIILPLLSNIDKMKNKIRDTLTKYKYKPYQAFYECNAILRVKQGYFCTCNASRTFNKVDVWLFKIIYKYFSKLQKQEFRKLGKKALYKFILKTYWVKDNNGIEWWGVEQKEDNKKFNGFQRNIKLVNQK